MAVNLYTANAQDIVDELQDVITLVAAEDIVTLRQDKHNFDLRDLAKVTEVDEKVWNALYQERRICMEYPRKDSASSQEEVEYFRPVSGQIYDRMRRANFQQDGDTVTNPQPFIERLINFMPKSGIYQPHSAEVTDGETEDRGAKGGRRSTIDKTKTVKSKGANSIYYERESRSDRDPRSTSRSHGESYRDRQDSPRTDSRSHSESYRDRQDSPLTGSRSHGESYRDRQESPRTSSRSRGESNRDRQSSPKTNARSHGHSYRDRHESPRTSLRLQDDPYRNGYEGSRSRSSQRNMDRSPRRYSSIYHDEDPGSRTRHEREPSRARRNMRREVESRSYPQGGNGRYRENIRESRHREFYDEPQRISRPRSSRREVVRDNTRRWRNRRSVSRLSRYRDDSLSSSPSESEDERELRHRSRYRSYSNSSSSSEGSPRYYTGKRNHKSPPPQKLERYDGSTKWQNFEFKFERCAERYGWSSKKMAHHLLDCLTGRALEYIRETDCDYRYEDMRSRLSRRFGKHDSARSIRRQLQSVRQKENETLEEFSERVEKLALQGFTGGSMKTVDQIAVEHFLKGLLDKKVAENIMTRNPKNLKKAEKYVRDAISIRNAIYGSSSRQSAYAKQVTFASDYEDEYEVRVTTTNPRARDYSNSRASDYAGANQRTSRFDRRSPPRSSMESPPRPMKSNLRTTGEDNAGFQTSLKNDYQRGGHNQQLADSLQAKVNQRLDKMEAKIDQKLDLLTASMLKATLPPTPPRIERNRSPSRSPRGNECFGCGKYGHFQRDCPLNRKTDVKLQLSPEEIENLRLESKMKREAGSQQLNSKGMDLKAGVRPLQQSKASTA